MAGLESATQTNAEEHNRVSCRQIHCAVQTERRAGGMVKAIFSVAGFLWLLVR